MKFISISQTKAAEVERQVHESCHIDAIIHRKTMKIKVSSRAWPVESAIAQPSVKRVHSLNYSLNSLYLHYIDYQVHLTTM